jgi:hypothetical protein
VIVGRRMPCGAPGWGGRVVRLLLTTSPTRRSLPLAGILVYQSHTPADGDLLFVAYVSGGMESVPSCEYLLHLLRPTSSLRLTQLHAAEWFDSTEPPLKIAGAGQAVMRASSVRRPFSSPPLPRGGIWAV